MGQNKSLNKLLDKEVNRRQFLTYTGGVMISLVGVRAAMKAFGIDSKAEAAGVLTIPEGGTGQSTAESARSAAGLNIEHRVTFSDTNYTLQPTDRYVAQMGNLTSGRIVTLPAASTTAPGYEILITDESGSVSSSKTISILPNSADTIEGINSSTIKVPFGSRRLRSDGTNSWSIVGGRRHAAEIEATSTGELTGTKVSEQLAELDERAGSLRKLSDLRVAWEEYDDFTNLSTTTGQIGKLGWQLTASGGGIINYPAASEQISGGVARLGTGTTSASAYSVLNLGFRQFAGSPEFVFEWRAKLEALNNSTQKYSVVLGLGNFAIPAQTAGFWFSYISSDTSWHTTCRGSATNNIDTNILANTGWHNFRIISDGGSSVRFYIDDALVSTHISSFPTVQMCGPTMMVQKTLGTGTSRSILVDYFYGRVELAR